MQPNWQLEKYLPLLRLLARRILVDPRLQAAFDVSDLVGETMLRAHKNLATCAATTEAELIAWLEKILRTVALDNIRRGPLLPADSQPSPSEQARHHEARLQLAAALEKLPDDQRDVIILIKHGLSIAAIAAQMGRTEKSVAGLYRRGLERLRQLLDRKARE
jgi:RNA polymerase sigma-70 factor (ECF subfamily)